jgi:hypothetical protein
LPAQCYLKLKHKFKVVLVADVVFIQRHVGNGIDELDDGAGGVEARCWVDWTAEDETARLASIE